MLGSSITLRIIPYALATLVAFSAGWAVNGWKLEAKLIKLQADHVTALAQANADARKREQNLQAYADKIRRDSDAKIKAINSALSADLYGLRDRSERSSGLSVPNTSGSCVGASGSELARDDASFLTRLAALAARQQESLNMCLEQYNAAKKEAQ
jgi:hypothetical protein